MTVVDIEHSNVSVLVLKPDGYRKPEVRMAAESLIRSEGLDVLHRAATRLTSTDVWDMWPKLRDPGHPVVGEFTRLYITSGDVEYFVVRGENVVDRCLGVRRSVRELVGTAAFENGMHTAENEQEREELVRKFWPHLVRRGHERGPEKSVTPGFFGDLALADRDQLTKLINDMWKRREMADWSAIFVEPARLESDCSHSLVLRPGDPNSIDWGISAVLEALPDLSTKEAIAKYIEAEIRGSSVLARGSIAALSAGHSRLLGRSMWVDLI